jgi:hypothetical protein
MGVENWNKSLLVKIKMGLERFHGRPHSLHQAASVETERERKRGQKAPLFRSTPGMAERFAKSA